MKNREFSFERIIELITLVISEMATGIAFDSLDIPALEKRGYTFIEISTALSWIADKLQNGLSERILRSTSDHQTSFRVLNDFEKTLFTKEGWGEVLILSHLGIITSSNVEEMIESAALSGATALSRDDVRNFVAVRYYQNSAQKLKDNVIVFGSSETIH